jgi:hypothetical protein
MFGRELTLVFLFVASLSSIGTLFFLRRLAQNVYQGPAHSEKNALNTI